MTGLRRFVLLLIVGALLALGALWLARTANAQELKVTISVPRLAVGEENGMDLEAGGMSASGLGAWTIDVMFDPDLIAPTLCETGALSVCNPDFADGTVRIAGATTEAFPPEGNLLLATMFFECLAPGEAELTVVPQILVDQTLGDPQAIDATVESGSFTCEEEEVTLAPTPTVAVLAPTGTGGQPETGDIVRWLIAAFAGLGLACIVSFGVLRLRAGRS